jgi:phosphatidylglycerophosphate synthase
VLDGVMRRVIDPPLALLARPLARLRVSADALSLAGLLFGLGCAGAIAAAFPAWVAVTLLALGRLADGLDGALARHASQPVPGPTDFGGYIDIVFDFIFYGAVPLAFAVRDQSGNGIAAAVLLFSFYVNGASFLAFATLAAKRGLTTRARGEKSLYFTAGLAEGTETIAVFVVMCLWPRLFPPLAWGFACVCFVTAAGRVLLARRTFGG